MSVGADNKIIQTKISKNLDKLLGELCKTFGISKSHYCEIAILEKVLRDFPMEDK